MTLPTIKLDYSLDTEVRRLLFTSASIAHAHQNQDNPGKRYLNHNFYILPELPNNPPNSLIYLPHLPYHSIPNYWETLSTEPAIIPFTSHKNLYPDLRKLLSPIYDSDSLAKSSENIQANISNKFSHFWQILRDIYPTQTHKLKNITIHPTEFGSIASYSKLTPQNQNLTIYLRTDSNFSHLAEVVLLALIKHDLDECGWQWPQLQSYAAHLLTTSSLATTLSDNYHGLYPSLNNKQLGLYRQKTNTYLHQLKLDTLTTLPLKLVNNALQINGEPTTLFGPKESLLLSLLLTHQGTTVTYESIYHTVWPNNYEIEPWRITKLVERIRNKLETINIHPTHIQSIRGKGYTLS